MKLYDKLYNKIFPKFSDLSGPAYASLLAPCKTSLLAWYDGDKYVDDDGLVYLRDADSASNATVQKGQSFLVYASRYVEFSTVTFSGDF